MPHLRCVLSEFIVFFLRRNRNNLRRNKNYLRQNLKKLRRNFENVGDIFSKVQS